MLSTSITGLQQQRDERRKHGCAKTKSGQLLLRSRDTVNRGGRTDLQSRSRPAFQGCASDQRPDHSSQSTDFGRNVPVPCLQSRCSGAHHPAHRCHHQARATENYAQTLLWFPLLHTSLLNLQNDASVRTANDLIGHAEEIMQGVRENVGAKDLLKQASHMLSCDGLNIPLQQALQSQGALMQQFAQGNTPENSAYDNLLSALRNALQFTLTTE